MINLGAEVNYIDRILAINLEILKLDMLSTLLRTPSDQLLVLYANYITTIRAANIPGTR